MGAGPSLQGTMELTPGGTEAGRNSAGGKTPRGKTLVRSPLPRGRNVLRFPVLGDGPPGNLDIELLELLHDVDVAERILLVLVVDQVLDALDHASPGLHRAIGLDRAAGE